MKVRDVISRLETDGWYLLLIRGSHRQFKHEVKKGRVTVAGKPRRKCRRKRSRASGGRHNCRRNNEEYVIFIEKGESSYGAYVPDLPGCVAVGETVKEVKRLIAEAVPLHLEGLARMASCPEPATECEYLEVGIA